MAPDDDDAEDGPLGQPLPPDDRLWRHPSELSGEAGKQQIVLISKASPSLGRTMLIAVLAGLIGAGTTLGVLLGTDVLVRETASKPAVQTRDVSPDPNPGASEIETADKVLPAIARVEATGPKGTVEATAFAFRSNGLLITTADAVDGAEEISVYLRDGSRIDSPDVQLVGRSINADVAVLQIPRTDLAVAIEPNHRVAFAEKTVMVDASPVTRGPDITVGVVTNENTQYNREDLAPIYGLVETTTRSSVQPRSPGTVFVDSSGTVIGIVTSRAQSPGSPTPSTTSSTSTYRPGLAPATTALGSDAGHTAHFAISADYVWDVATQLADTRGVVKPWVGIRGDNLTREEAERENLEGGMKIRQIEPGSPAATDDALRPDDIVIALNNETVSSYNDWVTELRRVAPGSDVNIRIQRDGDIQQTLLKIGSVPDQ